jgi:hypothetical protein
MIRSPRLTIPRQRLTRQIRLGGDEELGAEVLEWILGCEVLGVLPAVEGESGWGGLAVGGGGGRGFGHFL